MPMISIVDIDRW